MGKVDRALQTALEEHGVSQYALAKTLGIERANVSRWVTGYRIPKADRVADIVEALVKLNPAAAEAFVYRYLGELLEPQDSDGSPPIAP